MTHDELKQRHRALRDHYPPNLNLRVHRALSWLKRSKMADDDDGRFIFLWIAFNAAYACEIDERCGLSEQGTFMNFLERLCVLDTSKHIDNLVWQEFSGGIRVLLDTPFVFQSFWDFQAGSSTRQNGRPVSPRAKKWLSTPWPAGAPPCCWARCLTGFTPCATN